MKKYLLLLILPFMFLNNVYAYDYSIASESSSSNYLDSHIFYDRSDIFNNYEYISPFISLEYFTIRNDFQLCSDKNINAFISFYDGDFNYLSSSSNFKKSAGALPDGFPDGTSFICKSYSKSGSYIALKVSSSVANEIMSDNTRVWLGIDWFSEYERFLPKSSGGGSNTSSDSVYSSFITLYLDRIGYLANGFTTNPYLLAMVGIIFSFIVLEILLHFIHMKGGYKK